MAPIVVVAGARPNFMKVAPILRALARRPGAPATVLVHTGQHYDDAMSDVFFRQLDIRPPDVSLEVGSGSHGAQTARIMLAFEDYLLGCAEPPAGVVVVGDVNSTMACALVATKLHIPVAHVEAGLRSFDRTMPEEINRVVTDAVSDLLLVSEPAGIDNLRAEGVAPSRIRYVGNVMIDTLVHQLDAARAVAVDDVPDAFALVTLHRPSNVDRRERLAAVVDFLAGVAAAIPIVFPVHPRTDRALREFGLRDRLAAAPGVHLREPLGYRELLHLLDRARLVISDSGGIQEESTYLGVPCVTLRPNTERPITVAAGTNTVVDDLDTARAVVADVLARPRPAPPAIDGWDGRAAERVADALLAAWCPPAVAVPP
ncbi:MAG: UDP-N-acetylglucosamine 2-epimerase (non-hydrolyzing) [Deltaproteobacteria bacterium]|nr:MAG: UDP-N-acetylglucosamine 2-epimerase (non-hydrolyzing) [Deltaproteobacteria bacterium]